MVEPGSLEPWGVVNGSLHVGHLFDCVTVMVKSMQVLQKEWLHLSFVNSAILRLSSRHTSHRSVMVSLKQKCKS